MDANVVLRTSPLRELNMSVNEELEAISRVYDSSKDFDYHLIRYNFRFIRERLHGPRILEMGCANGVMTEMLSSGFPEVDVVDGSENYLADVAARLKDRGNIRYHHSLFEDFLPDRHYSSIVMARALEHLTDPVTMLKKAATWLMPDGKIHIVVPNARSLHRRIGVAMGMIQSCTTLNERDLRVGHKRVYDFETIRLDVESAGMVVHELTGIFLKPLSNVQMETWQPDILDALYDVGKGLPDYCAEIYVACGIGAI
jgi:2-polyprenyl-3-methyl-5-hydroxy-6-metoxy-1,4-benzoquinol methylase